METDDGTSSLWSEKYRPREYKDTNINSILTNQIATWLRAWVPNEEGKGRALMVAGAPGTGKTTSCYLAAAACKMPVVEFNASDHRSRRAVQESVGPLALAKRSAMSYLMSEVQPRSTVRQCILMDEVDGISTSDAGGGGALAEIIRYSRVPIICTCNDMWASAIKTLKSRCDQLEIDDSPWGAAGMYRGQNGITHIKIASALDIKKLLEGVLVKEHMKGAVTNADLDNIVGNHPGDMRAALNSLQMMCVMASGGSGISNFDKTLGSFELARLHFSSAAAAPFDAALDLSMMNTGMLPLFVHENYLNGQQRAAGARFEHENMAALERITTAADHISFSDQVDRKMRLTGYWQMEECYSAMASVAPVRACGASREKLNFPAWMGKNSTSIGAMNALRSLSDKAAVSVGAVVPHVWRQDYTPFFTQIVVADIQSDGGAPRAAQKLSDYHLERGDWDDITKSLLPSEIASAVGAIESQTKSRFTRACTAQSKPEKARKAPAAKKRKDTETTPKQAAKRDKIPK